MASNDINYEKIQLFVNEFKLGNLELKDGKVWNNRTKRFIGVIDSKGFHRISAELPLDAKSDRKLYAALTVYVIYALHGKEVSKNKKLILKSGDGLRINNIIEVPKNHKKIASNRKFTPDQINEIRARYLKGDITQQELADMYKVSKPVMNWILQGKTYANIPNIISKEYLASRQHNRKPKSDTSRVRSKPAPKPKSVQPAKPKVEKIKPAIMPVNSNLKVLSREEILARMKGR